MAAEPQGQAVAEAPPDAADALAVLSGGRRWALVEGDCVAAMRALPENSVDAVVCDPPYGLEFMGKDWDKLDLAARREDNGAGAAKWEGGGGFSKPGIGERRSEWPSFASKQAANPTCAKCGGRQRGVKKCSCEVPEWKPTGPRRGTIGKSSHPGFSDPDENFKGFQLAPINASANVKCNNCGKWKWDHPGRKCECDAPDFPNVAGMQASAMQKWHMAWLVEAFRILKPGGHIVAFGGTRTHHRLFVAAEDVGFEVRDMLAWLHGQGFPKSMDVGKAVDDSLGAEREDAGPKPGTHYASDEAKAISEGRAQSGATVHTRATVPATPEGAKWDGWGTALKPAVEPILLARKPLGSLNVAGNVLRHGTGALNIGASRIKGPKGAGVWGTSNETTDPERVFNASTDKDAYRSAADGRGRFPANVVLSHSGGCTLKGTKKVATSVNHHESTTTIGGVRGIYSGGKSVIGHDYADADGTEEVEDWACVEGCPILELDRQSGPAGAFAPVPLGGAKDSRRGIYGDFASQVSSLDRGSWYGDSGGASRFYYCAKAPTTERWFWCRVCGDAYGDEGRHAAHERRCASCGIDYPLSKHKAHSDHDTDRNLQQHPTQKPEDLMAWLIRLVTPPDGVALDPFTGSGTTGVAATRGGFRFIGCERERDYAAIARRRIEGDSPLFNMGGGAA